MILPSTPVVSGFHPDPSVCRVGDTYYLANSSFEYAPGVPIYRSTDLRSWEHIANALDRPTQLNVDGAGDSAGIFAPTLRHHDGRFWMITTNLSDNGGHLLVTADDPAGPWSDPVRITDAPGIDPDLAWGDDGTCYLTWSGFSMTEGPLGIVQAIIDPTSGTVLSEPVLLWQGTGGTFPEGPHIYKVGNSWYLLIAEGGTERGHAATIARAPSPSGPFEASPRNPLVTARGSGSPVQNTGHADLVEGPDGNWSLVYLGVRPRGTSPQWHVLGRETFASAIDWEDGWPVLGLPLEHDSADVRKESLDGPRLPLAWIAPGRFPEELLTWRDESWQLQCPDTATFVGRRQEHLYATVRTRIRTDAGAGGLQVRIDPRHSLSLLCSEGSVEAVVHMGSIVSVLGTATCGPEVTLELRVVPSTRSIFSPENGPDELVVGLVEAAGFLELGRLDGRYISTEVAGGMTGRIIGLSCSRGVLGIDEFTYIGSDDAANLPS